MPEVTLALALFLALTALWTAFRHPHGMLLALLCYLPFETVVVRGLDPISTAICRYGSESVIYVVVASAFARRERGGDRRLLLLVGVVAALCVASSVSNRLDLPTAVLGSRQILRFMLLALAASWLNPDDAWLRRAFWALCVVLGFQGLLGLAQATVGEALVLPMMTVSDASLVGVRVREAVEVSWDWNRRVPGTLGRYDRMGHFLSIAMLLVLAVRYQHLRSTRPWLGLLLGVGFLSLVLTYSRASWVCLLLGVATLGVLHRDRRVLVGLASVVLAVVLLLLSVRGQDLAPTVDHPDQDLRERVLEMFAAERYRGSYRGLGRAYWIVQTPRHVVASAPLLGVGPGRFGGGAASAMGNREVYDALGLPFGVYGTDGYVDNNWLSIVGEIGLLGLLAYLVLLAFLLRLALRLRGSSSSFDRAVACGFLALLPGFVFGALLATNLEIRTIAPYFWVVAGLVAARACSNRAGAS